MTAILGVSLLVKIPLFLGFLVFFVAWLAAMFYLLYRIGTNLGTTSTAAFLFMHALPLDLLGFVGLLVTLALMGLFFDLGIAALLLLAIGLGYLLTFLSWEVLGPLDRPFGSRIVWASARFALNERFQKVKGIIGLVVMIGVAVALSYVFFTEEIPSSQATQRILQILLIFIVVGVLLDLPQRLAVLLSTSVDEDFRTRLLLLQFGTLFAWVLYISLLVWSFGIGGEGVGLPGSGIDATLSVSVLVIIVALFAATSLVPYLLGWRRARWWRQHLLQSQRARVDRLLEILKSPGEAGYEDELAGLRGEVADEYNKLLERDPMVQLGVDWEGVDQADQLDPKYQAVFQGYVDARTADSRLKHIAFLRKFQAEVCSIADGLAAYKRKDHRRKKSESYISYYDDARRRIDADLTEETGRNWVWAAGTLVVLPIMGGILSKVGEHVWEIVDKTPPS